MAISFNTIPSNMRVPLFYAEVDNSMANSATTTLKTLLIGALTDDGKVEAGKPVLVESDSAGKELFGRGSMLAMMNTVYRKNDAVGEVWAIPVDMDSDAVAASGSFTITGEPSCAGVITVYVGAERVQVAVSEGAQAKDMAQALADAITGNRDLPVTTSVTSTDASDGNPAKGIVTLTAKNKGVLGNDIPLGVNIKGFAAGEELPEGVEIAIAKMAGGAGTPDFKKLNLEQVMGDDPYDFILLAFNDTASLDALKEIMNDQTGRWSYSSMLYGHVYTAKRGTVSDLRTLGSSRNNQHETIVGFEEAVPSLGIEVLAAYGAQNAAKISIDPARPTQTLELIGITSAPEGSRFVLGDRQTLLSNGIATEYTQSGYMRVERAITTYQKNAFGDADNSYLDSETMHTLAYIIRALKSCITSKYPRHKLASDGTRFGAGQAVVTPSILRGEIIAMYAKLEDKAIVENADLFAKHLIVERNKDDPNRVDVLLPPDLVNQLRVFAVLNQFRLQY